MKKWKILGLVLVIAIVSSVYLLSRPKNDYASGNPGPEVVVSIPDGATGAEIATTLRDKGVVRTRQAFLTVIYSDDRAKRIQPGGHRVQTRIPASEALTQLLDRERRTGVITLPEGLRVRDVVVRLAKIGIESTTALKQIKPPSGYPTSNVEGFLFPGQYAFTPETTPAQALQAMVDRFVRQTPDLERDAQALGYSPYQSLIMASLVQAEGDPEDYSKILRVILNRLKIGMPLQFDTTVLYALNDSGRIRVTTKDLQVNSPYNTYKVKGLPPTPICNPGSEALASLASPAAGNWLYYITVKPGVTRFTASHDQFLVWKREFQKNYRAGLFS